MKTVKTSSYFWGKTDSKSDSRWNPLVLHLIDVAASADAILCREPYSTRERMGEILGLSWDQALPWFQLIIACHDLGKACPGFQCKWDGAIVYLEEAKLRVPTSPNTHINHAFVSQIVITQLLIEKGWSEDLAEKIADAVGCHHGERAGPRLIDNLEGDRKALGDNLWFESRKEIFHLLLELFKPTVVPEKSKLSGSDFMLIAGLTSFADWIGSNENWFPFGTLEDTHDLNGWWEARRNLAEKALDSLGWEIRCPLSKVETPFEQVFNQKPRPLQEAVAIACKELSEPSILLIEAPMGEGKTEAAFYAHLELQRRFGHRGLYIALPTKATGNAMFKRTLQFLRLQHSDKSIDFQLLHGATQLNDDFQELRLSSIDTTDRHGGVRAAEWFTHKKRALLSEYGVGTVDQALLSILPVRHQFVRLWGLANRVVVFDEVHAYDTYTGTLLLELIRWLLSLGSSVVLLSATLPPGFRQKLAEIVGAKTTDQDVSYPRLSLYMDRKMNQIAFNADPQRRYSLKVEGVSHDLSVIKAKMEEKLGKGGLGLILVNTVQRSQELYQLFASGIHIEKNGVLVGKVLPDGTEVFLFHARYPADKRQEREDYVLSVFGKDGLRDGRKILIATQVVEQSLDLDFDCIATDLAPIDLIIQRAGRLWRHQRISRPVFEPVLLIAGLMGEEPLSFGKPLWWDSVYREDVLLRTWVLLRSKVSMLFPDEIDDLVQSVYEEQVIIPENLQKRYENAIQGGEGKNHAYKGQAYRAIIGFPDDDSWDKPERYLKADDDDAGLHPSLIAQTRLGERSIVVIPIFPHQSDEIEGKQSIIEAKHLYQSSLSISRKGMVNKLISIGNPESWKESPLLRNCYPLLITDEGCWQEDPSVRLDDELGLVYVSKEDK